MEAVILPEDQGGQGRVRLRRGGARNTRLRTSQMLTEKQCRDAIEATRASIAANLPPNRFITIAWEKGEKPPEDAVSATGQFVKLASDWLREQGHKTAWVWVQEWGAVTGAHCHILLHVPPELDLFFRVRPRRWVRHILGGRYIPGVIQSKRLYYAPKSGSTSLAYLAELRARLHYMLKCASPEVETRVGALGWGRAHWGQRGQVFGKRLGVWQSWRRYSGSDIKLDRS